MYFECCVCRGVIVDMNLPQIMSASVGRIRLALIDLQGSEQILWLL